MRQLKSLDDLYGWVRRMLGAPQVKVELTDEQIYDCVITALDLFLKWAMDQSTEEAYYVLNLEGGKAEYDLNQGILDVLEFNDTRIWWKWNKHIIYFAKSNVQCGCCRFS